MKEKWTKAEVIKCYILTVVALVIILLLASMVGIEREKTAQIYLQRQPAIAQIRHENKRAILDLMNEVDALIRMQAADDMRRIRGDYNPNLFEVIVPPLEIGGCTDCHYQREEYYNSFGLDYHPTRP
jgi:hypothetical protein